MERKIDNWTQWWDAHFRPMENGHTMWVSGDELRCRMSPKFRRAYDRAQKILLRKSPEQRIIDAYSRRYVRITTLKYKARKGRRRRTPA